MIGGSGRILGCVWSEWPVLVVGRRGVPNFILAFWCFRSRVSKLSSFSFCQLQPNFPRFSSHFLHFLKLKIQVSFSIFSFANRKSSSHLPNLCCPFELVWPKVLNHLPSFIHLLKPKLVILLFHIPILLQLLCRIHISFLAESFICFLPFH